MLRRIVKEESGAIRVIRYLHVAFLDQDRVGRVVAVAKNRANRAHGGSGIGHGQVRVPTFKPEVTEVNLAVYSREKCLNDMFHGLNGGQRLFKIKCYVIVQWRIWLLELCYA